MPEKFDYQRYLLSKRSVEQRSLNGYVWEALLKQLADRHSGLRILELGGGVGSMAVELMAFAGIPETHYTLVEASAESLSVARKELAAPKPGWAFEFVESDLFAYLDQKSGQKWDLLIAHAMLDLLDLRTAVPRLLACLRPSSLFYFPINYDGLTIFEPEADPVFERDLFIAYHRTMDERRVGGQPSGDSRTGRHLLSALPAAGAEILAVGPSDWMVIPQSGSYHADEAFFLACILDTIESALRDHKNLDQARFASWLDLRRGQLERGDMIFIAHQIDILGKLPG